MGSDIGSKFIVYDDPGDQIYLKVYGEFLNEYDKDVEITEDPYCIYNRFLLDKGFGLRYVGMDIINNHHLYEILDERKWMLARIKYGI